MNFQEKTPYVYIFEIKLVCHCETSKYKLSVWDPFFYTFLCKYSQHKELWLFFNPGEMTLDGLSARYREQNNLENLHLLVLVNRNL